MTSLLGRFAACVCALGGLQASASAASTPNELFGIRIGVPLDKQFRECPADAVLFAPDAAPCWKRDRFGGRVVLLPKSSMGEIGSPARVDRVREWDGVVVEIEVEFPFADRRKVERHMLKQYGKPVETETYEMASRVGGLSKHTAHTWRGNGVTVYFLERSGGDNTRVRGFLDDWAKMEAEYQKQRGGG